jgi:hypothetical protein
MKFSIEKSDEARRNKIKKSPSMDFFCCNFYDNLKTVVALAFLTPHGSRCATAVAIVRLLSRKAGELQPVSFMSIYKICSDKKLGSQKYLSR